MKRTYKELVDSFMRANVAKPEARSTGRHFSLPDIMSSGSLTGLTKVEISKQKLDKMSVMQLRQQISIRLDDPTTESSIIELRKKKLKLSGRREDLVSRIIDYDAAEDERIKVISISACCIRVKRCLSCGGSLDALAEWLNHIRGALEDHFNKVLSGLEINPRNAVDPAEVGTMLQQSAESCNLHDVLNARGLEKILFEDALTSPSVRSFVTASQSTDALEALRAEDDGSVLEGRCDRDLSAFYWAHFPATILLRLSLAQHPLIPSGLKNCSEV